MCGIAGIFSSHAQASIEPALLARMLTAIAHRGPDGEGVWVAPGVALGHRRLAVIDPVGSPQPMVSADGGAVLVFNGEIYNHRTLRAELVALGARFLTHGDSEVILAAWQQWGVGCLDRLEGMFAFALYDRAARRLLLARDRLGVKPLYYARLEGGDDAGTVIFGSELKVLRAHPRLPHAIDPLAVADYLAWGFVPDHRSILKGVHKLPAGHYLWLGHEAPLPAPARWWDVDFTHRRPENAKALTTELGEHLRAAVTSRMVADVPLGAFLSGGVDSSSVVALMAEASPTPVLSTTIGFDVAGLDESAYAASVAKRFGTDHAVATVSPDDMTGIDDLAAMFDEPFADASALPTWRLCQLARTRMTVALSGDGADEAFAGYRRHRFLVAEERVRGLLPVALRAPLFGGLSRLYPQADWAPRRFRAKATLRALSLASDAAYAEAIAMTSNATRAALTTPAFHRLIGDYRAEEPLLARMASAPARSALDRAQYADLTFWLPGRILTKLDRTSMAVGLEAREPLLDHRLIAFAASLPEATRIHGGQGKWLLKQAMVGRLPEDILWRAKQGFVTPIDAWFRGPLAEHAREIAAGSALVRTGWFDSARLAALAEAHIAGERDHSRLLWQMLMLDKALARLG